MAQTVKNLPAMYETQVSSLGQGDSPKEGTGYPLPTPVFWHGESHEQRSLADTGGKDQIFFLFYIAAISIIECQ